MNWRDYGHIPYRIWDSAILTAGGPDELASREAWEEAGDHSALCLAMLFVESRYGTAFNRNRPENRNPLNLRPPDGNGYMAFRSWIAGVFEWRIRVTSRTYKGGVYARTVTLDDLINVYAPRTDSNDPEEYIALILAKLAAWGVGVKESPESYTAAAARKGADTMVIAARECPIETFVVWDGPNRPGLAMPSPSKIVTHEVGNKQPGADEDMHRRFVLNGGGEAQVSFHFVVGPTKIVQLLYLDENAWHASDGYTGDGNRDAWGIEHIQIGDFDATLAHGAWLQAELAKNPRRFAIKNPATFQQDVTPANLGQRMVRHYDEAPDKKWCPEQIMNRNLWEPFKAAAVAAARANPEPAKPYPIWWTPGDIGPQRRSDGEVALAMKAEVRVKSAKGAQLRQGVNGKVLKKVPQGAKLVLLGTNVADNKGKWAMVALPDDLEAVYRVPLVHLDPRYPTT